MKILKKRTAFTLIEIIAALAILALGILSILSLFPVGQQASSKSNKISKATILGQKKLEELTRGSREQFSGGPGLADNADGTFPSPDNFFDWEYDTSPPPSANNNLVFVCLGIYWPAVADRPDQQSVKFGTYISKYS
jgi:type II secretory pathway pseudopilin PulG